MEQRKSSAISKLYERSQAERRQTVAAWAGLEEIDVSALDGCGLSANDAELMIENVVGRFALPMGVATNFLINGRDYLIPLVIEEPSVVAACSYAAKLFRAGGGFVVSSDESIMIGQVQLLDVPDIETAVTRIGCHQSTLLQRANETAGNILARGGGAKEIETRVFADTPVGAMLVVHLDFDTRDAMGANAINTVLEHIAPALEEISGGRANLRILSNLSDRRKARATGTIPVDALGTAELCGQRVGDAIVEASVLAEIDPYRAATHNKGIMNGIDALMIATGNDWRAVEAGAHVYAARNGRYSSLTKWRKDECGNLTGKIELPLALGIVGGATRVHRGARAALNILGVDSARELAQVAAAVGLAQNFAAMRALATEGIQRGHMRMHARQIALAAGAEEDILQDVVRTMISEGRIRPERARELVREKERKQ